MCGAEAQQRRHFTAAEASTDAGLHVMAGDVIDEGMQQRPEKRRDARAVGFVENENFEALTNFPKMTQVFTLEVMEE